MVFGYSLHALVSEPLVTGISVVYVHSANKAKLTKWYQDTLGLTPAWHDDDWTKNNRDAVFWWNTVCVLPC